jgi:hypothetical protein
MRPTLPAVLVLLPLLAQAKTICIDGFTFEPTDPATDELCDGMVTIHLNDMGHAACILGNFTRLK